MGDLFNKIIGGQNKGIPQYIEASLNKAFTGAYGIEWAFREGYYEAVFYLDKHENIAKFDLDGNIFENRINQPLDQIPSPVRTYAEEHGEIMNCISIHLKNKKPVYEIIVRDIQYERFLLMVTATGKNISKMKL